MSDNEALASAAAKEVDRWEQAVSDELLRLFDRMEAVTLARLQGTKARKHTRHWTPAGDRALEVKGIIDPARWIKDAAGSLAPVITRLFSTVYARVHGQLEGTGEDAPGDRSSADPTDAGDDAPGPDLDQPVKDRLDLIARGVQTAIGEVEAFIDKEEAAGTAMPDIVAGVKDLYAQRKPAWAARIATLSAVGSINQAAMMAAGDAGSSAKQWLSRRDEKVRDTHVAADGQVRLLDERFKLGGIPTHPQKALLLFPGDPGPNVPLDETINCRCTLLFSPPRAGKGGGDLETKIDATTIQAVLAILTSGVTIPAAVAYIREGTRVGKMAEEQRRVVAAASDENIVKAKDYLEQTVPRQRTNRHDNLLNAVNAELVKRGLGAIKLGGGIELSESGRNVATAAGVARYHLPLGSPIKADDGLEVKDKVATEAGVARYHVPIGTPIVAGAAVVGSAKGRAAIAEHTKVVSADKLSVGDIVTDGGHAMVVTQKADHPDGLALSFAHANGGVVNHVSKHSDMYHRIEQVASLIIKLLLIANSQFGHFVPVDEAGPGHEQGTVQVVHGGHESVPHGGPEGHGHGDAMPGKEGGDKEEHEDPEDPFREQEGTHGEHSAEEHRISGGFHRPTNVLEFTNDKGKRVIVTIPDAQKIIEANLIEKGPGERHQAVKGQPLFEVKAEGVFTTACVMAIPVDGQPALAELDPEQEPHATLLFLGERATLPPDALAVLTAQTAVVAQHASPFAAPVKKVGPLGSDDPPATVAHLGGSDLTAIRDALLADPAVAEMLGNADQFPSFTPHVTLGYGIEASADGAVVFDRIAVWWGDDRYEFSLLEGKAFDKAIAELEFKDKVATVAGARHFGQPIGTVIVPDVPGSTMPAFSSGATPVPAPGGQMPMPHKILGRFHGGGTIELCGGDPVVRKVIAKYQTPPPDPNTTQVIAVRDKHGRIGAYVVWQTADGPQPKGTIVAVSVAPQYRGHGVGDQLVQLAAAEDPDVKPLTRPAPPTAAGVTGMVPSTPLGLPAVRDLSQPGDVPGTSGNFAVDEARIGRLQRAYGKAGMDTERLFTKRGRWDRAREKQQQAIIDHFLNQPGVKADNKVLIIGGLPGAGKTSSLHDPTVQAAVGIDLGEYVTVNADEVKAQMVKAGMVPDYPGLSPDEAASLYHDESFQIANALMRQAGRKHLNMAYDTSLKSSGQIGFPMGANPGAESTLLFVDVPVPVAKQRARDRYLAGGRYMPLGLIDKMGKGPRQNYDVVKRQVDHRIMIDNAGASPVVVDQGSKNAHRAAVVARAQAAAPAPAAGTAAPSAATPPPVSAAPTPAAAPVAAPKAVSSGLNLPAALPPVPAGARVFQHPQGKVIYVLPDGSMETYKPDGKRATSSATPQKLAAGYGGWTELTATGPVTPAAPTPAPALALVPNPAAAPVEEPSLPAPTGAMHVIPMDFNEAALSDVPKYVADPDYVFQQKVDGIRGVLVVEPGKTPWFASKKGDLLRSSTAAGITGPILSKLPPTPAGSPAYRVEGELLNGKWNVFDMVVAGQESTPYEQRQRMAAAWVDAVKGSLPQVQALPTARTPEEKQALWDAVNAHGAEGVMMKNVHAPYNAGARVSHTLKAKVTATADVVVLARNIGGKDNAEFGMLRNGHLTSIGTVSTGGKDKALGQIQVGDVVEVEYLWASADQKLTQPRIIRKRPDKTANDATDVTQLRYVDKTVLAMAAKSVALRLERAQARVLEVV